MNKLKLQTKKLKSKQPEYFINDLKATWEEFQVAIYLEELQDNGYIESIIFQPESFILYEGIKRKFYRNKQLKTKVNKVYFKNEWLLKPRIYTCDFKVTFNWKAYKVGLITSTDEDEINLDIPFISHGYDDNTGNMIGDTYLEVKASTFDMQWTTRYFTSRTQPWLYETQSIYVQLIKPLDLYKDTFVPKKAMEFMYYKVGKKKGQPKYKWKIRTLNEYINDTTR